MSGLLGSMLAGAGAGGFGAYGQVIDNRIQSKLEAAKAAALEERERRLMELKNKFQAEAKDDERAYNEKLAAEKQSRTDRDSWAAAELLYGKEDESGLIGEYGAHEYSVPGGTRDDIEGVMSGQGLLATRAQQAAIKEAEEKKKLDANKTEYDRRQDAKQFALEEKKINALLNKETTKPPTVGELKYLQSQVDADLSAKWGYDPEMGAAYVEGENAEQALRDFKSYGYPNATAKKQKNGSVIIRPGGFNLDAAGSSEGINHEAAAQYMTQQISAGKIKDVVPILEQIPPEEQVRIFLLMPEKERKAIRAILEGSNEESSMRNEAGFLAPRIKKPQAPDRLGPAKDVWGALTETLKPVGDKITETTTKAQSR